MSLPTPRNDYEIVVPDNETEEVVDENKTNSIEDQADLDTKREKELEEKRKKSIIFYDNMLSKICNNYVFFKVPLLSP